MRLAVVASDNANGRYRAYLPLRELERRGHKVAWPGDPSFRALEDHTRPTWDLLHIQRMHDDAALAAMRHVRASGVALTWDTDDDFSAVRRGSEAWHRLGGRRNIRRHFQATIEAARTAHVMTTTSEHLAHVYRGEGIEHVHVIENYLAPGDLVGRRRRHQGIVIGIVAAGEHEPDLRKLRFAATLERVLERRDGVRVVAIGADLRMQDHRYTWVDSVECDQLTHAMSEFDIGLAPLLDTAFNRARSTVKLKEYAAAGAMWVASPIGPYVGMGEEQGGLLAADDAWEATLGALLDDDDRRRALAERARAWAAEQTIRAGGARWQAAFREAVERARNGG
jgi:hypothetical protein